MREIHDALWLAFAVEGMAGVAALEGRADRVIALAEVAAAHRRGLGDGAHWPMFAPLVERWLALARVALGAAPAPDVGPAVSFDQAVEYALGDEDDPSAAPASTRRGS